MGSFYSHMSYNITVYHSLTLNRGPDCLAHFSRCAVGPSLLIGVGTRAAPLGMGHFFLIRGSVVVCHAPGHEPTEISALVTCQQLEKKEVNSPSCNFM